MKIELNYQEKLVSEIAESIIKIMDNKEGYVSVDGVSYDIIVKACARAGLDVDEDYPDVNGWQVDYWQTAYDRDGVKYYISGSMYYGDHSIGVDED